jgi:hypothetical protein
MASSIIISNAVMLLSVYHMSVCNDLGAQDMMNNCPKKVVALMFPLNWRCEGVFRNMSDIFSSISNYKSTQAVPTVSKTRIQTVQGSSCHCY